MFRTMRYSPAPPARVASSSPTTGRPCPSTSGEVWPAGQTSPGLIIVSAKLPVGRAAEWLHLLFEATSAEEYVNSIYDLP